MDSEYLILDWNFDTKNVPTSIMLNVSNISKYLIRKSNILDVIDSLTHSHWLCNIVHIFRMRFHGPFKKISNKAWVFHPLNSMMLEVESLLVDELKLYVFYLHW